MGKAAATKGPRVFVPLTKVDEEQRLVYGTITQQVLDKSGEMMDYETSKPNFEKWSNDIHEASGGLSKGNLRVMHGLTVAGKLTELDFNDNDQSIEVCSKVVDDSEWNKVLEGCYTGFSVGGRYGKKWTDTIDGEKITKFTAIPNEVSLVDNPCVPSATFSLVKADGAEEQIMFKAAGDEDAAELAQRLKEESGIVEPAAEETVEEEEVEEPAEPEVKKTAYIPNNREVAKKAEELAKTAGGDWMDYLEQARAELIKANSNDDEGSKKADEGKEDEDKKAATPASKKKSKPADKSEKVTPPGVMQKWTTSDGLMFVKKEDAVAHELTLEPGDLTEDEKLAARLKKALDGDPEAEELPLLEDFDRLGKVWNALSTPFGEDGQPILEKGMYTVERFARVLWDLGKLTKSIAKEGAEENNDSEDVNVSKAIKSAMGDLGESFKTYVSDQIEELLAGIDDEAYVCYYDYYYAAAKDDGDNALAKDICALLEDHKDSSRERREEVGEQMTKAFGIVLGSNEMTDELSPPMQKRFDEMSDNLAKMTKVATDAVTQVEELAKRMKAVEDTPMPRAPGHMTVLREGDQKTFFGKTVSSDEERREVLAEFVKDKSPEEIALAMIKASQNNGQQLRLRS